MIATLTVLIAILVGVIGGAALTYVALGERKPLVVKPPSRELAPLVPAVSRRRQTWNRPNWPASSQSGMTAVGMSKKTKSVCGNEITQASTRTRQSSV